MDDRERMSCELENDTGTIEIEDYEYYESDIIDNLVISEFGLGLKLVGHQTKVSSGVCDIICSDDNKNLIPIEVKRDKAGDASVGQILGYMKSLDSDYGIILAPSFMKRVLFIAADYNIKLFVYKIVKRYKYANSIKFRLSIYQCKYQETYIS